MQNFKILCLIKKIINKLFYGSLNYHWITNPARHHVCFLYIYNFYILQAEILYIYNGIWYWYNDYIARSLFMSLLLWLGLESASNICTVYVLVCTVQCSSSLGCLLCSVSCYCLRFTRICVRMQIMRREQAIQQAQARELGSATGQIAPGRNPDAVPLDRQQRTPPKSGGCCSWAILLLTSALVSNFLSLVPSACLLILTGNMYIRWYL